MTPDGCLNECRSKVFSAPQPWSGTRISDLAEAIIADPIEIQAMRRDGSRHDIAHTFMEVILRRNWEVPHNATLFTDKMVVLFYGRVVPVKPFTEIEFANFPLRCKDMEVSVNCAERHPRYLLTNLLVHPLRGRMRSCPLQNLVDLLPLSAAFCSEDLHYNNSP
jgi:hypothetical protein